MNTYMAVIGMEIHAELATKSKMFCACANDPFASEPNTNVCPVCLGLPGALPTLNVEAIRMLVTLAADLGSSVDAVTKWDRKNYFYPDLPKGYQISQFDQPLLKHGHIELSATEDWELERIHLEEDTGSLSHAADSTSLVDFNRAGVPLAELVTKAIVVPLNLAPGFAKRFCETYQFLLQRRGISMADMEKGQMRCEANISVIPTESENSNVHLASADELTGTKIEVKNLNSFRAVERAVKFEIDRQIQALEVGESLRMETRGWDETKQQTVVQRAKETSAEYRYFPEPDLPAINPHALFPDELVAAGLPFPHQVATQLVTDYGLSNRDADYFTTNAQAFADFAELTAQAQDMPEVLKTSASFAVNFDSARSISVSERVAIATLIVEGKLPRHQLRPLFDAMVSQSKTADQVIAELGLADQATDDEVAVLIAKLMTDEADAVAKYKAGKHETLGYLIGQAMRAAGGKLDPTAVRTALMKELNQ